jgi:hypothetical protein
MRCRAMAMVPEPDVLAVPKKSPGTSRPFAIVSDTDSSASGSTSRPIQIRLGLAALRSGRRQSRPRAVLIARARLGDAAGISWVD